MESQLVKFTNSKEGWFHVLSPEDLNRIPEKIPAKQSGHYNVTSIFFFFLKAYPILGPSSFLQRFLHILQVRLRYLLHSFVHSFIHSPKHWGDIAQGIAKHVRLETWCFSSSVGEHRWMYSTPRLYDTLDLQQTVYLVSSSERDAPWPPRHLVVPSPRFSTVV